MGFVRDAANVGTFGLAGLALGKKKPKAQVPPPMMTLTNSAPTSMIGGGRG